VRTVNDEKAVSWAKGKKGLVTRGTGWPSTIGGKRGQNEEEGGKVYIEIREKKLKEREDHEKLELLKTNLLLGEGSIGWKRSISLNMK